MTDFTVYQDGPWTTVYLIRPETDAAREWVDRSIRGPVSWLGDSLAVEQGYVMDLVDGIREDGLVVEGAVATIEDRRQQLAVEELEMDAQFNADGSLRKDGE